MKRLLLVFILIGLLVAACSPKVGLPLPYGAHDLWSGRDIHDAILDYSPDYRYHVIVYVDFDCHYCLAELDSLQQAYGDFKRSGAEVVVLDLGDSDARVLQIVTERSYLFPIVVGLPQSFLPAVGTPYTELYWGAISMKVWVGAVSADEIRAAMR